MVDLSTLLAALAPCRVTGPRTGSVSGVSHDSRAVGPQDLFVAVRGATVDGRRFAPDLQCAGVVADAPVNTAPGVPAILVKDARLALARAAAVLAGHPARRLPVVGITGTNGKTTTAWLLEAAMQGRRGLIVGTTGHRLAGRALPSSFTTPEAPVLQDLLRQAVVAGCTYAAMEVSSIGLSLRRADALPFSAAAFTSFSQDHLDFHGDMARYFAAKKRLFTELLAVDGVAVLNGDDPAIATLQVPGRATIRYGRADTCDVRITEPQATLDGVEATVVTPVGSHRLRCPLVGAHNLENAVCAFILATALGVSTEAALAGLHRAPPVPGRLERVHGSGPTVFVDYAHTPDALARVLGALRPLATGQLRVVFGCGGDRDASKRPLMGRVAQDAADHVILTSDNPRSEDPQTIVDDILTGLTKPVPVELDRRAAIQRAIAESRPEDVVVIAGKGHETTQTIGADTLSFDDRRVAAEALGAHP